jgi:hypothetical protein
MAVLLIAAGGVTIALAITSSATESGVPDLINTFDRSPAFRMSYPEGWTYQLGQVGFVLFGAEDTVFKLRPGPSIAVFRTGTLFVDTLEEELDIYLRRGPLRGDHFAMTDEIAETMLDERPALAVTLEGREVQSEDTQLMRAYVVITQADNGYVYVFSATTPAEDWEQDWPLFEAVLETADIRE